MVYIKVVVIFIIAFIGIAKAADSTPFDACTTCKGSSADTVAAECFTLFSVDESVNNLYCEMTGCTDESAKDDFNTKCEVLAADDNTCFQTMTDDDAKKALNFATADPKSYHVPVNTKAYITADDMTALLPLVESVVGTDAVSKALVSTLTPQACQTWLQVLRTPDLVGTGKVVPAAPEHAVFFKAKTSQVKAGKWSGPTKDACLFYTSKEVTDENQVAEDVSADMLLGDKLVGVDPVCPNQSEDSAVFTACKKCSASDVAVLAEECQTLFTIDTQTTAATNLYCEYSGCFDATTEPADFAKNCAILDAPSCFPNMAEADAKKALDFATADPKSYHVPVNTKAYITTDDMADLLPKVADIVTSADVPKALVSTLTPQACQTWLQVLQNTKLIGTGEGAIVAAAPKKAVFFKAKTSQVKAAGTWSAPTKDACLFYTSKEVTDENQVAEDVSADMLAGDALKSVDLVCTADDTTTEAPSTSPTTVSTTTSGALLVTPLVAAVAMFVSYINP